MSPRWAQLPTTATIISRSRKMTLSRTSRESPYPARTRRGWVIFSLFRIQYIYIATKTFCESQAGSAISAELYKPDDDDVDDVRQWLIYMRLLRPWNNKSYLSDLSDRNTVYMYVCTYNRCRWKICSRPRSCSCRRWTFARSTWTTPGSPTRALPRDFCVASTRGRSTWTTKYNTTTAWL